MDSLFCSGVFLHIKVHAVTDLGFLNGSGGNEYPREGVHGSLDRVAFNPRNRVQDLLRQPGLLSQDVQDRALLLENTTHNTQG